MAQEFRPGQTVPDTGIYRVTHAPPHPALPEDVTAIKGRQFPTCPLCDQISYELAMPPNTSAKSLRYSRRTTLSKSVRVMIRVARNLNISASWNEFDDADLVWCVDDRQTVGEMAEFLCRTEGEVAERMAALSLNGSQSLRCA